MSVISTQLNSAPHDTGRDWPIKCAMVTELGSKTRVVSAIQCFLNVFYCFIQSNGKLDGHVKSSLVTVLSGMCFMISSTREG